MSASRLWTGNYALCLLDGGVHKMVVLTIDVSVEGR